MTTITGLRFGPAPLGRPTRPAKSGGTVRTTWSERKVEPEGAAESFLAVMQDSPAERMAEAWLAGHGISREALKAMPPETREATLLKMAQELREALSQALPGGAKRVTLGVA